MLSPPYSPHADLVDELSLGSLTEKAKPTSVGASSSAAINANGSATGHARHAHRSGHASTSHSAASSVSSHSSSGDELTDNDDLEDEELSGSVPPEDHSRPLGYNNKRSASDAFLTSRSVDDDDASSRDDYEGAPMLDRFTSRSSASSDTFSDISPASSVSTPISMQRATRSVSPPSSASSGISERRMTLCWDALKTNPAKYLRQERSLLEMYPLRRHSWAGPGVTGFGSEESEMSSGSGSAAMAAAAVSSASSSKPGSGRGRGRRAHRSSSTVAANGNASAAGRGRRRGTPVDSNGTSSSGSQDSGEESSGQRSSGSGGSGVRVHDLSLNQIKDYSPPLSTLPPGKSLRAEWKGAPMDLSNDPDLHLLHPAEAHLASVLRLPCEVYLDSKRRLFAEKVHRLKQGLPFRRTDSQKACRIDVNKASRLFGAFEKIGWLDDELFVRFLE